ncbi:hypothetical protein [Chryseobacterium sp. JK1]|uniref:hypothetical protein n=1 Tax=Chryseobacterium sp. JK1 TaxID=874294 RepID=UPI003D692FB2
MKNTLLLLGLISCSFVNAQVGINTSSPTATLDVVAKNATGTATNVDGVLLSRVDRQRAQVMTGVPTSTLIYVNNVATGSQAGTAVNIDAVGYYYFSGTAWVKLHNPSNSSFVSSNIYTANGTLTGNRTVTQGANTLSFTGTAVNAFSVAGSAFSVDAANRRVGVGTIAPPSILSVLTPTSGDLIDALSAGIDNCGQPCGQGSARNITLFNANVTNTQFGGLEFIPGTSASGISGASIAGIDRDITNNYAGLQFFTRNATGYAARMTLKSSGNVGIGTVNPDVKLDVQSGGTSATPIAAIKIVDGNQNNNYVLTSDANGVGTWKPASITNIYNANGTLTGNRTVTQGANTLAFTGSAVNAFSVDGTTFSVDATNDRVGVGTAAPQQPLHVNARSSAVRFENLAALPNGASSSGLVIDTNGDIYKNNTISVEGQILRIGLNATTYNSGSEVGLRFSANDDATEMGNAPNSASNFINTIVGAVITDNVSAAAGQGSPVRTTDRVTLQPGVYKIQVRLVGSFAAASANNSIFVKSIVNNNEYSLVNQANTSNQTGTYYFDDYINITGSAQTVDFTISPASNNFVVSSNETPGTGKSYRSLILIQRLR